LVLTRCRPRFSQSRPDIDIENDPRLGGRAKDIREPEYQHRPSVPAELPIQENPDTQAFSAERDRAPDMMTRPSFQSNRRSMFGQLPSAHASEIDSELGRSIAWSTGIDSPLSQWPLDYAENKAEGLASRWRNMV
jgi:hypothetical protein